jgi:hypothetical protein
MENLGLWVFAFVILLMCMLSGNLKDIFRLRNPTFVQLRVLQKPLVLLQDSLIKSFTSLLLRDVVYILLCLYCSLIYHSLRYSLVGSARIDAICARPRHLPSTSLVGIANGISSARVKLYHPTIL